MVTKYHSIEINKAKICIYPMKSVRAGYLELRIRTGSAYEHKNKWGAIHLLEHMLLQGTHKFNKRQDLDLYQEEHGLNSNAWTGPFDLGVWIKFPKTSTNAALELLDELIFHPSIPKNEIDREVNVISQEFSDKWSLPSNRYSLAINKFLYGENHIAARDGLGQPDFIKTLTRQKLLSLKLKYFQPQNMSISIAGDLNTDYTIKKIEAILTKEKNLDKSEFLNKNAFDFIPTKKHFMNHNEDVNSSSIDIIWHIPGRKDLTLHQRLLIVIAKYLLGSTKGPIYKRLRQDLGLVYKTGASSYQNDYNGRFELWVSSKPTDVPQIVLELKKILAEFLQNEIPYKDFSRVTNYLKMQTLMSYDSVVNISQQIGDNLFHEGRPIPPEEYIKIARSITEKELREFLSLYLKSNIEPYICIMSKEKINA